MNRTGSGIPGPPAATQACLSVEQQLRYTQRLLLLLAAFSTVTSSFVVAVCLVFFDVQLVFFHVFLPYFFFLFSFSSVASSCSLSLQSILVLQHSRRSDSADYLNVQRVFIHLLLLFVRCSLTVNIAFYVFLFMIFLSFLRWLLCHLDYLHTSI